MLDVFPETIVRYALHSIGSQPVSYAPHVEHLMLTRTKKKFSNFICHCGLFCVLLRTWPTPTAPPWSVGKLPYLTSVPWQKKTAWDRRSIEYVYDLIGATPNLTRSVSPPTIFALLRQEIQEAWNNLLREDSHQYESTNLCYRSRRTRSLLI